MCSRPHSYRLSLVSILVVTFLAATANAEDSDADLAVRTVKAFHDRLAAGDGAGAAKHLGSTLFIADERTTGRDRLSAHFFRTGADLVGWPAGYLREAGPHTNTSQVVSVSVRGNGAVVITTDTGSNRFRKWKDEEVAWFLGRTDGDWRIVSMIYRDIQLPK